MPLAVSSDEGHRAAGHVTDDDLIAGLTEGCRHTNADRVGEERIEAGAADDTDVGAREG